MKINEKNAYKTLGDAFFIIYRRQLTSKDTKKHQKASADENLKNWLPGLLLQFIHLFQL